jgi:hypothetical protein
MAVFYSFGFSLLVISSLFGGASASDGSIVPHWRGETVQDLHQEYGNVFRHGNRNAASHRWATFLLDRASQMVPDKLRYMFSGFCAVSGSPVRPSDYGRYQLRLASVVEGRPAEVGFMYYCCWPCVCDTQDYIRVDTKTITTSEGPQQFRFAVIGNPCDHPEKLHDTFVQPFGFRSTTLAREAPEVNCNADGSLEGATMSDHGFVIISMFFDGPLSAAEQQLSLPSGEATEEGDQSATAGALTLRTAVGEYKKSSDMKPGRMSEIRGVLYQDEQEYGGMCEDRKENGFNSGMGEIFRRVAQISPIVPVSAQPQLAAASS